MSDSEPRRSIFAIIAGLVIIGLCLLIVAVFFTGFFSLLGPSFGSLIGVLFALPFVWLAYKQYSALFCCVPAVARAYHEAWFGFGIFFVFGGGSNLLEAIPEIMRDKDVLSRNAIGLIIVSVMFVCGLLFLVIGWLLRRQAIQRRKLFFPEGRKLLTEQSDNDSRSHDVERKRFFPEGRMFPAEQSENSYRLRKVVGIILILGSAILLSGCFVYSEFQYPEVGEHYSYEQLPRKSEFPSEGSDFSWRRGHRGTSYYEFTVSEEAFRRWISSDRSWEYCEPISGSFTIQHSIHRLKDDEERPSVTDGLCAGYSIGKTGGGSAVFDRSTNRAYYWTYY